MDTIGGVDRLLGNHRETVFALCLRVLRHRQDAEDACQEALLKIARRGPGEVDPARLAGWVHQVALRTAIDHHRAKARRKAREDKAAEQVPSPAAEADSMVAIAEALSELPEDERTLLVDHFFGRKTLRTLADERGCSEPAVWKRVEKSKDRLRKVLSAAAPAAVLAMNGFLEAAERPARWTPWRLAVTAVLPAIVVAGLAVVGLHRRPVSEPAPQARAPMASAFTAPVLPAEGTVAVPSVAPVRPAETPPVVPPYPYELPPRHWPEAKRAAWLKLEQTRIDLSADNLLPHEILADLSTRSGIPIRFAPDIPIPSLPTTLKVKDLILRNTLKLLVSQHGLGFDFGDDGTVWVTSDKGLRPDPDPRLDAVVAVRAGLDQAIRSMGNGMHGAAPDPIWAALSSKEIDVASREYGLLELVDRFREASGFNIHLNVDPLESVPEAGRGRRELMRLYGEMQRQAAIPGGKSAALKEEVEKLERELREQPVPRLPFSGGRKTTEAHLEELSRAWGLGWVPTDGLILIMAPNRAAEEKPKAWEKHRAHVAAAVRLDQPPIGPAPVAVYQLAEALSRETGLKVVPSEKAWPASITETGGTWRDLLEKLPAHGFRWLLQGETVYIDR